MIALNSITNLEQLLMLSTLDLYAYVRTEADLQTRLMLLEQPTPPMTRRGHLRQLARKTYATKLRILIREIIKS
jgi:hypothetical protein